MRYIILGAGAAGISAAGTLRALDKSSEILILSEDETVYSRCMLHHVIAGQRDLSSISFIDKDFFETNKITWMKGAKVSDIRFNQQTVLLADGSKLYYDRLLLAAGSKASIPPIKGFSNAVNLYKLRDIADADAIKRAASPQKSAVILGAGLIGLDAASALIHSGCKVTILEMADRVLSLQLDHHAASSYQKRLEALGASVLTGVTLTEALQDDCKRITSVKLDNGTLIECDLIIAAAGVKPNTEFIHGDVLKINRGIAVDDRMQTSADHVYAAGDITGLSAIWPGAVKQGRTAAFNMAGQEEHYSDYFTAKNSINLFGLGTVSVGIPETPDDSYEVLVYEKNGVYKKLICKDQIVYGVILQKDVSRSGFWTKVIKEHLKINTNVENIFQTSYADFFKIDESGRFEYRTT